MTSRIIDPTFDFYPRSPCGERQTSLVVIGTNCTISIHALLAESDLPVTRPARNLSNFYPRSPCGERQPRQQAEGARQHFYPRSPCGERPGYRQAVTHCKEISIHALLAESDAAMVSRSSMFCQFLSTLSLRRATIQPHQGPGQHPISIHALLAESDCTFVGD